MVASSSLKEYLKRYENSNDEEKKKKKKKKKAKPDGSRVVVVDEDPVWQKPVKLEEETDDSSDGEKPQVDEDVEVKRMKRLELLKSRRPYGAISEDGSGWVPVADAPKDSNIDISPPRMRRSRNDTPSPEPEMKPSEGPTPEKTARQDPKKPISNAQHFDISPPRRQRGHYDSPSLPSESGRVVTDLSPPRRQRKHHHTPPESDSKAQRSSGPAPDFSPPRRPRQSSHHSIEKDASHVSSVSDLSPPRKIRKESFSLKAKPKTGLLTGQDIKEEIDKTKRDDWLRFKDMDPSISGRGAEAVHRDKITGERISKDQLLNLSQKEEKPKEVKLEWGKGLAQKREAEARQQELELEKDKPFARTRDDPEIDRMLKDRVRWGDPMAHLVKRKQSELVLPDLGDNDKMKESGFIIPQDIPSHSWLKRGIDAPPNRYGIKPGRHWDGVDRSTGFEKEMFKRKNEKQATEREAYLWSVSDM